MEGPTLLCTNPSACLFSYFLKKKILVSCSFDPNTGYYPTLDSPSQMVTVVTFAICGAISDLSLSAKLAPVDYDIITTEFIARDYYYHCKENVYRLIDINALNCRITSSQQTTRRATFRSGVVQRDCVCRVTEADRGRDAAHIIPKCKGTEIASDFLRRYNGHPSTRHL